MTSQPGITITSPFWKRYRQEIVRHGLPYQWRVLNDEADIDMADDPSDLGVGAAKPTSHAMHNLRIAAGLEQGEFSGRQYQDTDVYKWMEAACYALADAARNPGDYDPADVDALRAAVDEAVDLIAKAQDADGYLDTKFQLDMAPEQRFTSLQWSHELYDMGHFIEAAVAHYEATGERTALDVALRVAACIERRFGDGPGQVHGPDGHPEIELALARLAEATGERRWLELAAWFLHVRGKDPGFLERQPELFYGGTLGFPRSYYQVDGPALELDHAEGHCVRQCYLATAMAKVGKAIGDGEMLAAARRIWRDIVNHQMYVTGNIGSTKVWESFTFDDDLPNDLAYGETCASVAMCFYARALLEAGPDAAVADTLELELFNGMLAGLSLDCRHFFYVNPLEADPKASRFNPERRHVLTRRADWFDCACCPANATRLIMSLDRYLYTVADDTTADGDGTTGTGATIYAHQFVANVARFGDGLVIEQRQRGAGYPWVGDVEFRVANPQRLPRRLAIRIPGWAHGWTLTVDGRTVNGPLADGFVVIDVSSGSTEAVLHLDMPVRFLEAAARVRDDVNRLAVARGPLVYCAEGADNPEPLWTCRIDAGDRTDVAYDPSLLDGVAMIRVDGSRVPADPDAPLYREVGADETSQTAETLVPQRITLVPYYAWANREDGQMSVWLPRRSR